ncbi:class I SAM-dependent methyltransferase [Shewanella psychrotolerans]|uniref:class I SAM-dependent methyltransferase n=1 Tax=Shewanella psychrotolerans TaxID=2864206 RepID=UPI001C65595C|nr:class I SAM-dependent methyltransferase [Shewanella psychrotolerans]QYK02085.1 class I SAM-dependent methyltransferase [Shewanella psychrotolerans]
MEKKRLKDNASKLLTNHLDLLNINSNSQVLDLACGSGRNGLWLAELGANVTFVDRDLSALSDTPTHCHTVEFNLETGQTLPLAQQFDIIIVFNYLHRPIFESLKQMLKPGGFLVYETFITTQAEYGRPKNPDFLLRDNELLDEFNDFAALHYFQGNVGCEDDPCFKAQLIAQKPNN